MRSQSMSFKLARTFSRSAAARPDPVRSLPHPPSRQRACRTRPCTRSGEADITPRQPLRHFDPAQGGDLSGELRETAIADVLAGLGCLKRTVAVEVDHDVVRLAGGFRSIRWALVRRREVDCPASVAGPACFPVPDQQLVGYVLRLCGIAREHAGGSFPLKQLDETRRIAMPGSLEDDLCLIKNARLQAFAVEANEALVHAGLNVDRLDPTCGFLRAPKEVDTVVGEDEHAQFIHADSMPSREGTHPNPHGNRAMRGY